MKAQLTGMSTYQGVPTNQSYLVINYLDRLEDGEGGASVAQYFGVFDPQSLTWHDSHFPALPLLIPVTLDPRIRVEVTEVFRYVDRPEMRTTFGGWAAATSLNGTEIDYTQLRALPLTPGLEPLTMAAARALLNEAPGIFGEMGEVLTDLRQAVADTDRSQANITQIISDTTDAAAGTLRQRRTLNAIKGYRAGTGPFSVTNGTLVYADYDGSGPLSTGEASKLIRLTWVAAPPGNAANWGAKAMHDAATPAAAPLSAGVWLRKADLLALPAGSVLSLLFYSYDGSNALIKNWESAKITSTQATTVGTSVPVTIAHASGAGGTSTLTIKAQAEVRGWMYLTLSATSVSTAAPYTVFLPRVTGITAVGSLDALAPAVITGLIPPYPNVVLADTEADLDSLTLARNATTAAAVANVLATGANARLDAIQTPPPLAPNIYVNAMRYRIAGAAGAAESTRYQLTGAFSALDAATTPSIKYAYDASAYSTYGLPNVTEVRARAASGDFVAASFTVLPGDLALIGIVPNDATPPRISLRIGILKASASNLNNANIYDLGAAGKSGGVQVWLGLRYGTAAGTPGTSTPTEMRWLGTTGASTYGGAAALSADAPSQADDGITLLYRRGNIPVPATYNGQPLTAVKIHLLAKPLVAGVDVLFRALRIAVIAGATAPTDSNLYLNGAEDQAKKAVAESDLAPALVAKILNPVPPIRAATFGSLGDSIGHGDFNTVTGNGLGQTSGAAVSFLNRAAILRGWTVLGNACISGTCVAQVSGKSNAMVDRYQAQVVTAFASAGHVVMEGGINDYEFAVPLGTLYGDTDLTHFYPAYLATVKGMLDGMPSANVTCSVPIFRPGTGTPTVERARNTVGVSVEQYRQAIRDVVAYLQNSGYAGRVVLVEMDKMSRDTLIGTPAYFDASGYHPTDPGHAALAQLLAPQLA